MNINLKLIYKIVGYLFLIAGIGNALSLYIIWHTLNSGQIIGSMSSIGINIFFSWAAFIWSKNQIETIPQDEFEKTIKELKRYEDKHA